MGRKNTLGLDSAGMLSADGLLAHWYFRQSDIWKEGEVLKPDLVLISIHEPTRYHYQQGKMGQSAEDRAAAGFPLLTGAEVGRQYPEEGPGLEPIPEQRAR